MISPVCLFSLPLEFFVGQHIVDYMESHGIAVTAAGSSLYDPSRPEIKLRARSVNVATPMYEMVLTVEQCHGLPERIGEVPLFVKPGLGYDSMLSMHDD